LRGAWVVEVQVGVEFSSDASRKSCSVGVLIRCLFDLLEPVNIVGFTTWAFIVVFALSADDGPKPSTGPGLNSEASSSLYALPSNYALPASEFEAGLQPILDNILILYKCRGNRGGHMQQLHPLIPNHPLQWSSARAEKRRILIHIYKKSRPTLVTFT
jgi:hypothetical protein